MEEKSVTRREVLKIMGCSVLSAAMMASPLSSLASSRDARGKQMGKRRLVFYFTATGNSLFVAKALGTELVSIPQAIKDGKLEYEADEIGFVFPDYAATAPMLVRSFVRKAKLKASYIFSVITFGNFAANVAEWWEDYCQKQGVTNQYIQTLMMVDNYLPVFDMNEQIKAEKHTAENMAAIVADVAAHRQFIAKFDQMNEQMQGFLFRCIQVIIDYNLVKLRSERQFVLSLGQTVLDGLWRICTTAFKATTQFLYRRRLNKEA